MIEISFKQFPCKKCNSINQYAILKGNRYGIYCAECGSYIKWADSSQTTVIKARKDWIDNNG